jgi:hypothetical protein
MTAPPLNIQRCEANEHLQSGVIAGELRNKIVVRRRWGNINSHRARLRGEADSIPQKLHFRLRRRSLAR